MNTQQLKEQFIARLISGEKFIDAYKALGIDNRLASRLLYGRTDSGKALSEFHKETRRVLQGNLKDKDFAEKLQKIVQADEARKQANFQAICDDIVAESENTQSEPEQLELFEDEQNIFDKNYARYYEAYNAYHENRFDEMEDQELKQYTRFVITSVQNDTKIHQMFYENLRFYCKKNNAKLLILPVVYRMSSKGTFNVDQDDLYIRNTHLNSNIKIMGLTKISPTITDPFSGIDSLSMGSSMIIAHNQLALKPLPTIDGTPAVMYATGSLSVAKTCYNQTMKGSNKTGQKALFNHSNSALFIDLKEDESFLVRALNADMNGDFSDVDGDYTAGKFVERKEIEALVLGDEHAFVSDPLAKSAVFTAVDSMVNVLNPRQIVRHDIFDTFCANHHEGDDHLLRAAKSKQRVNDLEAELLNFVQHLEETTYPGVETHIVGSNHNEHLYKYISNPVNLRDVQNAEMIHFLCYHILSKAKTTPVGPSFENVLEVYLKEWNHGKVIHNVNFLGRRNGYQIKGIEVSLHGDIGSNGAKGSPKSFARLPVKTITGHTHTPTIDKGNYTNGCLTHLKLGYNKGPSSWLHSATIIYPNGKRQMIIIVNGRWR